MEMALVYDSLLPRREDSIPKWSQMLALRGNPKKKIIRGFEIFCFHEGFIYS